MPLSVPAQERIERVAHDLHGAIASPRAMTDAVAAVSHVYTRQRGQMGSLDKRALLARAGFFWPRDLVKVFGPLDELVRLQRAPRRETLRVLDVGAGLGATSFGLARWLRARALPVSRLHVVALERNASALKGFSSFVRALRDLPDEFVPIELAPRASDLCSTRLSGDFDIVLFGFVLNELYLELPLEERIAKRADLLRQAGARLGEGGSIIVLEPALKETTRELMHLRDALASTHAAPFVIAPCLHERACPMLPSERDWCHQELPFLLPKPLAEVAKAASLRYEGLSYASLVLANEPRAHDQPQQLYRIVSDRLVSKGKLELLGCGPSYQRFTRLDRDESEANEAFGDAQRGSVLAIAVANARIEKQTEVTKR